MSEQPVEIDKKMPDAEEVVMESVADDGEAQENPYPAEQEKF